MQMSAGKEPGDGTVGHAGEADVGGTPHMVSM